MDYGIFDSLLDSVFVIAEDRSILYCNEAGAALAGSSVKRLTRGKKIFEVFIFEDKDLFVMPDGTWGKDNATPLVEVKFEKSDQVEGRVQLAIQPFTGADGTPQWVIIMRDVTLEEVLHKKYHTQLEEKEGFIEELKLAKKELEDYSKNLEKMVEERTKEVKKVNIMLNAIMNSLGQGFLVFDESGECSEVFTKACEDVLETIPAHKKIWDVFGLDSKGQASFKMWVQAVYSEALPFENLRNLAPNLYNHSLNKHVTLEYYPLYSEEKKVNNLVVVATDKTAEREANIALEKERQFAKMVIKMVSGKKQFAQFLKGAKGMIDEIQTLICDTPSAQIDPNQLFRLLHTFEGEVATYSVQSLWIAARSAQEVLEPIRSGVADDVESIMKKVGNEVENLKKEYDKYMIDSAQLFELLGMDGIDKIEVDVDLVDTLDIYMKNHRVSEEVRHYVQGELLRQPIGQAFSHFNDVARAVASRQMKEVQPIKIVGGDYKVFHSEYRDLFSSLVHAFRNAVDHGLEPPEEREQLGKSREGKIKIQVKAFESDQQSWLKITVIDDGRGIDSEVLKNKLIESGCPDVNSKSSSEILQMIFEDGLTTRSEVGDFSGRGVGMSAIKFEVEKLGGRVRVESQVGQGTRLYIEIPDLERPLVADHKALAS